MVNHRNISTWEEGGEAGGFLIIKNVVDKIKTLSFILKENG